MARYSDDFGAISVNQALNRFVGKTIEQIESASEEVREYLENYAKENHPWQNRTYFLETSTTAVIVRNGQNVEIVLTAGLDEPRKNYALFLELYMNGKWTWLWNAMEASAPEIIDIYKRKLNYNILGT